MHPELAQLLEPTGIVVRRSHPHLVHAMDAALRTKRLLRILPGIYGTPRAARSLEGRARAICLSDPDAVITGDAAAWLAGGPLHQPDLLTVASPRKHADAEGFRFERRRIPPHLTRRRRGYTLTSRSLTALETTAVRNPLEDALRQGASVDDLDHAMSWMPRRRGNKARRRRLEAVRDRPWSAIERRAHSSLRHGRVRGWVANRGLYDRDGILLGYGDIVFADLYLVIEIDGAGHGGREQQVRDSARDLDLRREGWEVIRFGAGLIDEDPRRFAALVRDIVASRRRRRPPRSEIDHSRGDQFKRTRPRQGVTRKSRR